MKKIRSILIVLWIMLFLSSLGLFAKNAVERSEIKRMNAQAFTSYMNKRIPELLGTKKVPGAAIVLVHKGRILQIKGYGYRDKSKKLPVTADTVFQVGSISKSMTAWGIMKLIQENRMKLDYPLNTYLLHWRLPKSKFDNSKVTIRGLLSHTAGISVKKYPGYHPNKKLPTLRQSLAGKWLGTEKVYVKYKPEVEYRHSEGGYTLLQLALEEVTREDFSGFMEREVIKPLGMKDTSFTWRSDLKQRTAKAYDIYGFTLPNYLFTAQAATGLYSTPSDLARWMIAVNKTFLGESEIVLNQEMCHTLFTPVSEEYGWGHIVQELPFGEKYVSHNGSNHGWKAYYGILAQKGEGIVILTNSDRGMSLIGQIMDDWFAWQNINRRAVVTEDLPLYFLDLYLRFSRIFQ